MRTISFQVISFLGKGTFGQVVKCVELHSGEEFAVKILKNKRNFYYQGIVEAKIMLKVYYSFNIHSLTLKIKMIKRILKRCIIISLISPICVLSMNSSVLLY